MRRRKKGSDSKKTKKKIGFRRLVSNNLFALHTIWSASPVYMTVYLGSSLVYGLLGFLGETYVLRYVVNGLERGKDLGSIVRFVVILACVTCAFRLALSWFWMVISPKHKKKINMHIVRQLFKKSAEVELSCYENPAFYDQYVKAMEEATNRTLSVMYTLDSLIAKAVSLSANSFLLFLIDPWLILFGLFPLVLGFLRRFERVASHSCESEIKEIKRREKYVKRTFYLNEYAKEMRVGGMWSNMLRDLRETWTDFRRVSVKYGFRRAVCGYIRRVGLDVVTVLGATLYAVWSTMCVGASNGGMSVGDCIVVIGSIGVISSCLNDLVQNLAEFGEHAMFLEDVRYFLAYEPAIKDGTKSAPEGGDLEVKDLSFRYEGCDRDTLQEISFCWKRGERIALVGSNGSGKTTLIKLLLRLYDPQKGSVSLDGTDVKDLTLSSYRSRFGTVFQDFKMFSLSVKENVLLRPTQPGDDELVEAALRESGAWERVARMEHGIDTILTREFDEKGENLSVGEQQKLSLARIFADRTPFVILDEPSSALDPIAEYTMFQNMMRATEGRSVLFISHRLSSAVLADRVLLMDGGRIAESGTHEELMARNGKYAEMFRRQAENYLGSEVNGHE